MTVRAATAKLYASAKTVSVSGLKLSAASLSLKKGSTYLLKYTVAPANATAKNVTFRSSDAKIASVDSRGKVTAKNAGTCTVTAVAGNNKKAACKITVLKTAASAAVADGVTSVRLSKRILYVEKGHATRVSATVQPSTAKIKTITWKTSNPKVATVDKTGKIKTKTLGHCTVYAYSAGGHRATCSVNVSHAVAVKSVSLSSGSSSVAVGKITTFSATLKPTNATSTYVGWSSSNKKVATVSSGVVRGVSAGTCKITATSSNGKKTIRTVTVVGMNLSATFLKMYLGSTTSTLIATMGGEPMSNVQWSSSNPAIATVDANGVITPVAVGSCVVTAVSSDNTLRQTCTVEVHQSNVTYTPYNMTFADFVAKELSVYKYSITSDKFTAYATPITDQSQLNISNAASFKFVRLNNADPNYYSFVTAAILNNYIQSRLDSLKSSSTYGTIAKNNTSTMRGKGQVFIDAAKKYGMDPIYLVSHAGLESAWGCSKLAQGYAYNGKKYYNFYGIGAVDSNAISGGQSTAYNNDWSSVDNAISGGAEWIYTHYISASSHNYNNAQNTIYKFRWNIYQKSGSYVIGHQYFTSVTEADSIAKYMQAIYQQCGNVPTLAYDLPQFLAS